MLHPVCFAWPALFVRNSASCLRSPPDSAEISPRALATPRFPLCVQTAHQRERGKTFLKLFISIFLLLLRQSKLTCKSFSIEETGKEVPLLHWTCVRVHSAGHWTDILLFFLKNKHQKKSQRRAQTPDYFSFCCYFYSLHTAGLFRSLYLDARFLLLKKISSRDPSGWKKFNRDAESPWGNQKRESKSFRDWTFSFF